MHQPKALQRIIDVYFREPARSVTVKAGTQVLKQDGYNDKLYWVKKGELSGYLNKENSELTAKVFRVDQGMFFLGCIAFSRRLLWRQPRSLPKQTVS